MSGAGVMPGLSMRVHGRSVTEAQPQLDRRVVFTLLAGLVLLAAVLRLPFLGHGSFWYDEIYTRDIVGEPTIARVWSHVRATESTPPLYYLIAWLLGGRSAAALRAPAAVALLLVVPATYLAFRRLVGQRVALAAAAFVAVSPELTSFGLDARSYGLFVLTAVISVWGWAWLLDRPSRGGYALWIAGSVACVWTHYFGAFLVIAEVTVLLVASPAARRATCAGAAAIVACAAPLVPLVLAQNGDERAAFISGVPLTTRLEDAVRQFAMGPNVPRTWLEAMGLAVVALALAVGAVRAFMGDSRTRPTLALAMIAAVLPLALAVTGLEDRLLARNVLDLLPIFAALAAAPMLAWRGAPLALYLGLAVLTSVWVSSDWRYGQADWRTALARAERIDPAAGVLALTPVGGPIVRTYLGRAPVGQLDTAAAWILVEPRRTAGHRDLVPMRAPVVPSGFHSTHEFIVHAFRVLLIQAPAPKPVKLPGAIAFPGR